MKKLYVLICQGVLLLVIAGCKKENTAASDSIQGLWEIRRASGMMTTNYPPGNGKTIRFTNNVYEISSNGLVTQSGQYEIVQDSAAASETCLVIPAGQYTNRIVYDNNATPRKEFIQISGKKLTFLSGCFAYDAGSSIEYVRQ